jgi:hypothetical protein
MLGRVSFRFGRKERCRQPQACRSIGTALAVITAEEAESLRRSRSQFVTLKRGHNIKYLPYAFTEHGAIMAATVLNSTEAIQMSVFVVRAFIKMREALISRSELERRLLRIENVLLAHDESIRELYDQIRPLLLPPPEPPLSLFPLPWRERRDEGGSAPLRLLAAFAPCSALYALRCSQVWKREQRGPAKAGL